MLISRGYRKQSPAHPKARLAHSEAEERRIKPATSELAPELRDAIAMEWNSAKDAGALGYMAKLLCQVTMPHSKLKQTEIERVNGDLTVTMIAPSKVGLPYGTYPRLIMAHVTKQAVLKRSPCIELGDSLSAYMSDLGLSVTGGRWGSIARLREHLARLLTCSISCTSEQTGAWGGMAIHPVEEARLWWDAKQPDQKDLWQSELTLNHRFFEQIISNPVPIDERVLRILAAKRSPLAIDI